MGDRKGITWRHFRLFKILFKLKIVKSVAIGGGSTVVDVEVADDNNLEYTASHSW